MNNKKNAIAKQKVKIPTVQELSKAYEDKTLTKEAATDGVLQIVNTPPPSAWLRDHPFVNVTEEIEGKKRSRPYKYLTIERVEFLMNNIFKEWRTEVLNVLMIANAVTVTVRVHYKHPITKEWSCEDGVGASPIQTDKNAGASDWMKVKSDAVQKALPAAKSYAVKDACEGIGQIFGSNIERKTEINYDFTKEHKESFEDIQVNKERARVLEAIEGAITVEELDNISEAAKRHGLLQELTTKGESLM